MAHPPSLALPRPVLSGEGSSSSSPHIQPSSTFRSDSSCRTYSSAEDASPTAPTYNLNTRSEAIPVAFEMQIVSLDSYMARPIPNVDIGYSSFMGEALRELPVIRVFGSTPAGQSVCAHIHNIFPYFFLPFHENLLPQADAYIQKLTLSIDRACDVSLGRDGPRAGGRHVYKIMLVRGTPFYGFQATERLFLKVFLLNPMHQTRIVNLLRSGAIMGEHFQPFEAHIPYLLQFFIDYNLYGMGMLKSSNVLFRTPLPSVRARRKSIGEQIFTAIHPGTPVPSTSRSIDSCDEEESSTSPRRVFRDNRQKLWHRLNVSDELLHSPSLSLPRDSGTTDLEVDIRVEDVLNYLDAPTPPTSINHPTLTVQSLSALWEDERRRRRHLGLSATPSPLPASVRHSLEPLSLEVDIYERLRRIAKADLPASIGAIANPPSSDSSVSHSDGEMIRALQSMFEPSLQLTQSHAPAANDALLVSRQPLSGSAPAATDGSKDNAEAVVNREIAQTQYPSDDEVLGILEWMQHGCEDEPARGDAQEELISTQREIADIMMSCALQEADEVSHKVTRGDDATEMNDVTEMYDSTEMDDAEELPPSSRAGLVIPQFDGGDDELLPPRKRKVRYCSLFDDEGRRRKRRRTNMKRSEATEVDGRNERRTKKSKRGKLNKDAAATARNADEPSDELVDMSPLPARKRRAIKSEPHSPVSRWKQTQPHALGGDKSIAILVPETPISTFSIHEGVSKAHVIRELGESKSTLERNGTSSGLSEVLGAVDGSTASSPLQQHRQFTFCIDTMSDAVSVNQEQEQQKQEGHDKSSSFAALSSALGACGSATLQNGSMEDAAASPSGNGVEVFAHEHHNDICRASLVSREMWSPDADQVLRSDGLRSLFGGAREDQLVNITWSVAPVLQDMPVPLSPTSARGHVLNAHTGRDTGEHSIEVQLVSDDESNDRPEMSVSLISTGDTGEQDVRNSVHGDMGHVLASEWFGNGESSHVGYYGGVDAGDDDAGDDEGSKSVENSCSDEAAKPTQVVSDDGSAGRVGPRVFKWGRIAPKWHMLLRRMKQHKIPTEIYREPYYGDSADKPKEPVVFAGHVFDIPTDSFAQLDVFEPTLAGFESKHFGLSRPAAEWERQERSQQRSSGWFSIASAPPSAASVRAWAEQDAKSSSASKRNKQSSSQIQGVTPHTTQERFGFVVSQGGVGGCGDMNRERASSESPSAQRSDSVVDHMTVMSVEVFAHSRGKLLPNPLLDPVHIVSFSVFHYCNGHSEQQRSHSGLIIFDEQLQQRREDGERDALRREKQQMKSCRTLTPNVAVVDSEDKLFDTFVDVVCSVDPDVLLGYEVQRSSIGYMIERVAQSTQGQRDLAAELGRAKSQFRNRAHTTSAGKKESTAQGHGGVGAKQDGGNGDHRRAAARRGRNGRDRVFDAGDVDTVDAGGRSTRMMNYSINHGSGIVIPGRIVLNTWRVLRSEVTTNIYTQQNMAYHILHRRMPLFSNSVLTAWFESNGGCAQGRHAVSQYVMNRTRCNIEMLCHLNIFGRTAELARIYGIDFYSVLTRGSQYRVESMMLRLTKTNNYILLSPSRAQVSGMSAPECLPLVMEPQSRLFTSPVVVLDFQSLYPSIIIAYNYCFSTCLGKMQADNDTKKFGASFLTIPPGLLGLLSEEDAIHVSPNEVMFVKPSIRRGILPILLQQILETRVMVKEAMKRAKKDGDMPLYRMLDARQFGLKMIANVTYGYTSASFSGRMPCIDIADSIVQMGRQTLERAISLVEETEEWNAEVVYGDTDSMFVLLKGASRSEAFRIGREIARRVTKANPDPVKLKFEKVYLPCTLLAKKRYVGAMYESEDQENWVFDAKGIETVRRDTCPLVSKVLRKTLSLLFDDPDISRIKTYVTEQFAKVLSGRASVQDFMFAKEVRLGTYSARGPPPPAALVAMQQMERDPRAEPHYGERVPYVVVNGTPHARLMDVVMSPTDFLKKSDHLSLHATYYITKQIIPALDRVLSLVGVDVRQWYAAMPRSIRRRQFLAYVPPEQRKSTIDQYYLSKHCPVCDGMTNYGVCDVCIQDKQRSVLSILSKIRHLEEQNAHMESICMHCSIMRDATAASECESFDCSVMYERHKLRAQLKQLETFRGVVDEWSA